MASITHPSRVLGDPLPNHPHALSVHFEEWRDVEGYEEGQPRVINAMTCGYPRFFLHPYYKALCEKFSAQARPGEAVWAFPSQTTAEKCLRYVGAGRSMDGGHGITVVFVPEALSGKAKEFWQHAGLIVSSRQAKEFLDGRQTPETGAREELKRLVATFNHAAPEDVYLYPSGMGAVFLAYEAVVALGGPQTVQLGFPYVDIWKIQERFGKGATYLPYNTPDDLDALAALADKQKISAVFCEVPGNPLLRTIDLKRLHGILSAKNIPLVIDDTLGPRMNIDSARYADVTVTSLTKFISGVGNVMGGALILNPHSPTYAVFKKYLAAYHEELLHPADAEVLLENAKGFPARMKRINANAEKLVALLQNHAAVGHVYYPKGDAAYDALRQPGGGYGGLFSFTLKDETRAPDVYNALAIAKGPSLGTEFTLACPYTLLAHYNELEWAKENGVSRWLIRVSVGIEDFKEIEKRFSEALDCGIAQSMPKATRA